MCVCPASPDLTPTPTSGKDLGVPKTASSSNTPLRPLWQALNDTSRLRLLALLQEEDLTVSELQSITYLSQSLISSHLAVLRKTGSIEHRRVGKSHLYSSHADTLPPEASEIIRAALSTLKEVPEARRDREQLKATLRRRREEAESYFNKIAGKLGKAYCPGRTWAAVGPLLAHLVPEVDVADLGAGEGWLTLMLAQRANRVIAVDNSKKMVDFARQQLKERKIQNVEYRLGDLEAPPIDPASIDIVVFSQALHHANDPERAILRACEILRPDGRIVILDLQSHTFEKAHDLYHDRWLGFTESELRQWLKASGMKKIIIQQLETDQSHPNLKPILASALKP